MNTEFNAFSRTGHVAYAYFGTNSGDKAEIYFTSSTNGGTNWTAPVAVNTVWTNDQWMPVLAVKPDGTKLFTAWYDRRADTNNGLMEVYGRWGTIGTNGNITLDDEFRITPVSFPPVFSGTDTNRFKNGDYDPVYPPGNNEDTTNSIGVNLQWWYPEWPLDVPGVEVWKWHVGEYNGAFVTDTNVVFTWTDNRIRRSPISNRHQCDIRLVKLAWP